MVQIEVVAMSGSAEAQYGSLRDDEINTRVHLRLRTVGGDLVGSAEVDEDATIGQLRARLNKPPEWYAHHKQFVIATTHFNFNDDYMRFTQIEIVKEHIRRDEKGLRTLDAVAIVREARG